METERDHLGADKAVASVEADGGGVGGIGQESDAGAAGGTGTGNCRMDQLAPKAMAAMIRMDNEIFQPGSRSALGSANGDENADHANDGFIFGRAIKVTGGGIFKNELEGTGLFGGVGREISFLCKKQGKQIRKRGDIGEGGAADGDRSVLHKK